MHPRKRVHEYDSMAYIYVPTSLPSRLVYESANPLLEIIHAPSFEGASFFIHYPRVPVSLRSQGTLGYHTNTPFGCENRPLKKSTSLQRTKKSTNPAHVIAPRRRNGDCIKNYVIFNFFFIIFQTKRFYLKRLS